MCSLHNLSNNQREAKQTKTTQKSVSLLGSHIMTIFSKKTLSPFLDWVTCYSNSVFCSESVDKKISQYIKSFLVTNKSAKDLLDPSKSCL